MTIKISFKNYVLDITFGRNLPWSSSDCLITIIKEWYDEYHQVTCATYVKGFFKEKDRKGVIK